MIYLINPGLRQFVETVHHGGSFNTSPGEFHATTDYRRAYQGRLNGRNGNGNHGHLVLAVLPRAGLSFQSAPRSPGSNTNGDEFRTHDEIRLTDTLLLAAPRDYHRLRAAQVRNRTEAMATLNRSANQQQEWESRVYERARIVLGLPVDPHDPAGMELNELTELLLRFRAESPVPRGMLLHFAAPPTAERVWLTGDFTAWSEPPMSPAVPLVRLTGTLWAVVVPEERLPPRLEPYRFRFVVDGGRERRWETGLYPVDPDDPDGTPHLEVSGSEVYFSADAATHRLAALSPSPVSNGDEPCPADFGRVRWLGVSRAEARADQQRVRWCAPREPVEASLRRIHESARRAQAPDIEDLAARFLDKAFSPGERSRQVYVSRLPHLYGYALPTAGSFCLSEDVLTEPRPLDLTLCRQLYALLDPHRSGAENERLAERLLSPTIVHVAMEMMPYARRGGVADVVHGLPAALSTLGQRTAVFLPQYSGMSEELLYIQPTGLSVEVLGETVEITESAHHGVQVYLLKHPRFGVRPYDGDELAAAVLFCRALPAALRALHLQPEIIHCHDWQTGLLPGYLRETTDPAFVRMKVLFTVHNLGYRGSFPNDRYWVTGLSDERHLDYRDGDDRFSLLIGGIRCAGRGHVNTVSSNYAREITGTDLGWGLQGVLREVGIFGILNGIDYQVYNPETDPHLVRNYTVADVLEARPENKAAVQKLKVAVLGDESVAAHMPEILPGCALTESPDTFLIGMIARIAEQKGLEVMAQALRLLLDEGCDVQFIFTGQPAAQGDLYCRDIIRLLYPLVTAYPNRALIRFSHEFEHALGQRMYAGCDVLVSSPSYEPCGLEPMKSCRYGCVPLVRATGGLADQVSEFHPERNPTGNGFVFHDFDATALAAALRRAYHLYRANRPAWNHLVQRCMTLDFSWEESARRYLDWYYRVSRE